MESPIETGLEALRALLAALDHLNGAQEIALRRALDEHGVGQQAADARTRGAIALTLASANPPA